MNRLGTGLLTLLVMGHAATTHAQNIAGWHASADVLWVTTHGNDDRIGDVIVSETTLGGSSNTSTLTTSPIAPQLDRTPSFLVEAGYRGGGWGYGGRGWRVSSDGDAGETVTTTSAPVGLRTSSVRLWNQTVAPLTNIGEPAGRSPLTYHASNELQHVRVEGYAERLWLNGPAGTVGMRFGLAYAHSEHDRHADLSNQSRTNTSPTTVVDETTATTAETTFDLIGPLFGITGDTPLKRLHVSWLISASALIGTADGSATFELTDVTRSLLTGTTSTGILRMPWADEARVLVPALDLQLKASYPIAARVDVGGGIFSSSLFDMPVTPAFDNHTGGWTRQTRDISFLAYSVFARVGF